MAELKPCLAAATPVTAGPGVAAPPVAPIAAAAPGIAAVPTAPSGASPGDLRGSATGVGPGAEGCPTFASEIADIHAYQAFVSYSLTTAAPWVFGIFVAFHDIVTMTVAPKFLMGDRRRLYCAEQVEQALRATLLTDLGTRTPPPKQLLHAPGVVGLDARHPMLFC
mmetsp:Transcript_54665/g.166110  ORF Transcript_54665/g.166110 Transcript_54665/m.166110 type:complete len:166 (-) Transcript_54665:10-507(-)